MTQPATAPPPLRRTDLAVFLLFLLVCGVFLAAGSLVTAPAAAGWYQTLQRPAFAPPDTVFAPAWTAIFLLMAVAGWRVWRRAGWTAAQAVFGLQLLLNFGWSALFFGLQRPDLALAEIFLLAGAIVWTMRAFGRVERLAAWLLAPYLAWVAFAAVLNAAFVWLN
ncbi:TspO/MBR family protein [Algiphilus aromaticivorans]|uniref:TspO/MBR family protein n=1 Tax=Algiphilus aromaticivorans TaxID=382454 RepID=UPI0005C190F6|nr:TspO/MBR family protein [Algiphilus aromaticivorans]